MKRVLFVTDRNMLTTSGELRLIKNRAEAIYNKYGIPTDFIAISSKDRITSKKREIIKAGGEIETFELSLKNFAVTLSSYKKIGKVIQKKIKTGDYGAVVLSGTVVPSLAKRIKHKCDIKVHLDIHGAFEDVLEVAKRHSGLKAGIFKVLYHVDIRTFRKEIPYCDGFFVVTEALRDYLKERFVIDENKKFFIVPCATSTSSIDEPEYKQDRIKYREKYGITGDEIVFVYSGGVSTWQCIAESIELFKKVSGKLHKRTRMLVFSHNISEIELLTKGDTRIHTDSYSPEELFHALRAGDFAFLLRSDNPTNNVAFPNKFLEYVQSGMHIITTPHVREIAKQVERYGLGCIYDFDDDLQNLVEYIQKVEGTSNSKETINSVLIKNSFEITSKEFVEGFMNE